MKEFFPSATHAWLDVTLDQLGFADGTIEPLRVEASNRHFYRIHNRASTGNSARSVVAMVSPPDLERNDAFVTMAEVFSSHRVGVPQILAAHHAEGVFLMTDLGTQHLEDLYPTPAGQAALNLAIDALSSLSAVRDPAIEPYTESRFEMELGIFTEWFLGALMGKSLPDDCNPTFAHLLTATQLQPKGCVHRDYHCRNLLVVESEESPRLGVVDFQDALFGPILYDIASLLHDCYYTHSPDVIAAGLERFISATPQLQEVPRADLQRWFELTAVQRQLKAIGIFVRLAMRDGKQSHLENVIPTLRRTTALCDGYADLAPLAELLRACNAEAQGLIGALLTQ